MDNLYITRLILIGTSKGIVVPAEILNGLKWQRGDQLIFTFAADDQLIIRRVTNEQIRALKEDVPTIKIK